MASKRAWGCSVALLAAVSLNGCGSAAKTFDGSAGASNSAGTGNESAAGGTAAARDGVGGDSSATAAAGAAGEEDAGSPVSGAMSPHAASALVAAGTVAHSPRFIGIFTLGESPGGNDLAIGKKSQARFGLIGASQ